MSNMKVLRHTIKKSYAQRKGLLFPMSMILKTDLSLTDDLDLGTNRKVLSKEILMWNIKAPTLTYKKIWPILFFFFFFFLKTGLDLADDPELVNKRKIFSKGVLM